MKKLLLAMLALAVLSSTASAQGLLRGQRLRFDPLSSNPFSSTQTGIYVDSVSGDLKFRKSNGDLVSLGAGGGGDSFPSQTGHSGQFLLTNGSTVSWSKLHPSSTTRTQLISPTTHVASLGIDLVYIVPAWVPSDVTQVRVWVSNCDMLSGGHPSTAITGVNVAIGTSNGSFDYTGSPTVYTSVTVPGNCIAYKSPLTSVTRGADGKILIVYSIPSGSDIYTENSIAGTRRCDSTTQVNPIPGGCASQADGALAVALEYSSSAARVVVLGDSILRGFCSGTPVGPSGTAWSKLGPDYGYAVSTWGAIQQTLAGFSELTAPWMYDASVLAGAYVFIEAGLNDLPLDASYKDFQTHVAHMVSMARAMGAEKVFLQTPTPNSAYGPYEAQRLIEVAWMRKNPASFGADGVVDADLALDPTSSGSLSATACGGGTCDCGDGTHLSAAANTTIEALLVGLLP